MRATLLIAAITLPVSVLAYEPPSGTAQFATECPGDSVEAQPKVRDEGLFAAILTPLLAGTINSGLKAWGTKLKESAQEQQVDTLHLADYFYAAVGEEKDGKDDIAAANDVELRNRCLIVATRGTAQTKITLDVLASTYSAARFNIDEHGIRRLTAWTPNSQALTKALTRMGYTNERKPGFIAVFDVELASTSGAAQLVPRFVVLDHSIREKTGSDRYARDITTEISFQAASAEAPFAKALLKFEGLKIGVAKTRISLVSGTIEASQLATNQLGTLGPWFVLPALDEDTKARITSAAEADRARTAAKEGISLAGTEAIAHGAQDIPTEGAVPVCDAPEANRAAWLKAASELQIATIAKPKDEKKIASRTKAVAFFETCAKYFAAVEVKETKRFRRTRADNAQLAESLLPFDAYVQVKEFRKRPVAEFFGNLLTDDTTRTGVTTALMNAVDPGTREAKQEAADTAKLKLRGEYEAALVAAETAVAAYATAKAEEQAVKFIDMEAKKRAANRIAETLHLSLPYPASGTWITIGG
jgi:hypothetical protein